MFFLVIQTDNILNVTLTADFQPESSIVRHGDWSTARQRTRLLYRRM